MNNKLYKCPDCSNVHIGEEWDKKTQDFTGSNRIVHIENGEFGTFYVCPNCGSQIDWDKIEIISKEKCNYCGVENKFSGYGLSLISKPYILIEIAKEDIGNCYFLMTNEYEELSNIHGLYSNSPFRSDKIKINYCPMCGRRL